MSIPPVAPADVPAIPAQELGHLPAVLLGQLPAVLKRAYPAGDVYLWWLLHRAWQDACHLENYLRCYRLHGGCAFEYTSGGSCGRACNTRPLIGTSTCGATDNYLRCFGLFTYGLPSSRGGVYLRCSDSCGGQSLIRRRICPERHQSGISEASGVFLPGFFQPRLSPGLHPGLRASFFPDDHFACF